MPNSRTQANMGVSTGDLRFLKLNQSTPQTVSGGSPIFSGGITTPTISSVSGAITINPENEILYVTGDIRATYADYSLGSPTVPFFNVYFSNYFTFQQAVYSQTLGCATLTTSNKAITVPNASGTMAVSATSPISLSALGDIGFLFNTNNVWTGTQYINLSDTTALKVGSTPTFQVDTINKSVGIGIAPSAGVGLYTRKDFTTSGTYAVGQFYSFGSGSLSDDLTVKGLSGLAQLTIDASFTNTTAKTAELYGMDFTYYGQGLHTNTGKLTMNTYGTRLYSYIQDSFGGAGALTVEAQGAFFVNWLGPAYILSTGAVQINTYGANLRNYNDVSYLIADASSVTGNFYGINNLLEVSFGGSYNFTPGVYGVKTEVVFFDNDFTSDKDVYGYWISFTYPELAKNSWAFWNETVGAYCLIGRDNSKAYFGTGIDASIYYDGTDFVLNTADVGTGVLKFASSGNFSAGGASVGTLTNAPSVGNPSEWLKIKDASGNVRYIPCWS